jgi:hypothetical protein
MTKVLFRIVHVCLVYVVSGTCLIYCKFLIDIYKTDGPVVRVNKAVL